MSVEQVIELLSTVDPGDTALEKRRAAVKLAMHVLPCFGDAVCAQMRWNAGEQPIDSTRHVEALQQYFHRIPGLEAAYLAVLTDDPHMLDAGPYFGSP